MRDSDRSMRSLSAGPRQNGSRLESDPVAPLPSTRCDENLELAQIDAEEELTAFVQS